MLFVLGSFLFLGPGVDASPQLAVARRFADQCTICSVTTHDARSAISGTLRGFSWRPSLDAQNAVLRRLQAEHDEGITLTPETIESLRALGYLGGR